MNMPWAHHYEPRHARLFPGRRRHRAPAVILLAAAIVTEASVLTPAPAAAAASQHAILAAAVTRHAPARHYTVRAGDTLSGISARFCGTPADYPGIAAASGIADPDRIRPGQRLVIICSGRGTRAVSRAGVVPFSRYYSYAGLERLWASAGGPYWAAPRAAGIALCESGGYVYARNPYSGAAGLWQILGLPFPGNPYNPYVNARMAVVKFRDAGDTFAPWVCQ